MTCNAKIGLQPANVTGQQSTKVISREWDVGKAVAEAGDAETDAVLAGGREATRAKSPIRSSARIVEKHSTQKKIAISSRRSNG